MKKTSRIIVTVVSFLVFLISLLSSVWIMMWTGFLTESFHRTLLASLPLFSIVGFILWIYLLIRFRSSVPNRKAEIIITVIIFVILLLPFVIMASDSLIWCLEAQIKGIELLPGKCWYN